jgi:hypothetical protein
MIPLSCHQSTPDFFVNTLIKIPSTVRERCLIVTAYWEDRKGRAGRRIGRRKKNDRGKLN